MSNIKEVHGKHRLHVSVMTYYWEYDRHVVRLRRHCCRCAYVPTSNAASHDKHEKINSWVFFSFLYEYGALFGSPLGHQSSAINTYAPYFSFTIKSVTIEEKKNLILKSYVILLELVAFVELIQINKVVILLINKIIVIYIITKSMHVL